MELVEKLLAGERLALARAITAVENERPEAEQIMLQVASRCGRALVIGITGSPGAGKSTLVDKLALEYRRQGKTIGIIAVDPTSPFTGGAILGDRLRMSSLSGDKAVFIRSMGTRGNLGGLSVKTADATKLMDAFGKDIIIIETVGVGQSETEIMKHADVTVVVCVPGMGDDIQAIKAGIMEIADILVINKADRDGTDKLERELMMMIELNSTLGGRIIPICKTVAIDDHGVMELSLQIERVFRESKVNGELAARRSKRRRQELIERIRDNAVKRAEAILVDDTLTMVMQALDNGERDVYSVQSDVEARLYK